VDLRLQVLAISESKFGLLLDQEGRFLHIYRSGACIGWANPNDFFIPE
jgi:hypothetical protein